MTTPEAAKATGATERELQVWDEKGYVSPRREGNQRVWDERDLRVVRYIVVLRKIGLSIRRIAPLLPVIRAAVGANGLWLVRSNGNRAALVTSQAKAKQAAVEIARIERIEAK